MKEKSVVGDLINFRGLVYSPMNENGVIFLFGKVMEDLNMYIEEIKPGFPDCIGRRFTGKGWEKVAIEFEYSSSNFQLHGHDPTQCDIVVCWEHDWESCPLEVIELRDIIRSLPNKPITRPDAPVGADKAGQESHLQKLSMPMRTLFDQFDAGVKQISPEIFRKVTSTGFTYYSPERVFIYLVFQKKGLRLELFTRGQKVEGVHAFDYEKGGAKWGRVHLKETTHLEAVLNIVKKSHALICEAIKANEPTGWFAELEDDNDEEGDELPPDQVR